MLAEVWGVENFEGKQKFQEFEMVKADVKSGEKN